MRTAIILVFAALLALPAALAACPAKVQSTNTVMLFSELASLNTDLQSCPGTLPQGVSSLIGNGGLNFVVNMNDGTVRTIFIATSGGQITGVSNGAGSARYTATTTETTLDTILSSGNPAGAALSAYAKKSITLRANTFFRSIGLFFVQPFARAAVGRAAASQPTPPGPSGKPENCDGTYLPGHRGYAENKALWDSYSANTDDVCQAHNSELPRGGHCEHTVQLSVSGNPYYLCWYNN
jgi:hypothetical protein